MEKINWSEYYHAIYDREKKGEGSIKIASYLLENYPELRGKNPSSISRMIRKTQSRKTYKAYRKNKEKGKKLIEIVSDKKIGEDVDIFEIMDLVTHRQKLHKRISQSQSYLKVNIPTEENICVMVLGDTQLGSFGTDSESFKRITEQILGIDNLYVILVGDLIQMAIKLRGVAEVMDNALPINFQYKVLEKWIEMIKHKVIAATWCNHAVMREENATGFSYAAKILSDKVPYFDGIGHIDLTVGEQTYKIAASHFFRGKSMYNAGHAPMRYMREMANDREIAVQGDFHRPGIMWQIFGGVERLAIVCGSIQTNSGYAKRFFSLETADNMPCFTLNPHEHKFNPYPSVGHWLTR